MDSLVRFSSLVRKGLRYRRKFEDTKRLIAPPDFGWYPYDCFANLFYVQGLLKSARLSLDDVVGAEPVLDLGAADGALSFFLESLGYEVHAYDYSGTNINRMAGIRSLAASLRSQIQIHDIDLDTRFDLTDQYGAAFFLGALYHLKNPYYVLELLAKRTRFCFVSTRVARWSVDRTICWDNLPLAYLLAPDECNLDATNYWIFSPTGLRVLATRAGWTILASANSGPDESDPVTNDGDQRTFLLMRSNSF